MGFEVLIACVLGAALLTMLVIALRNGPFTDAVPVYKASRLTSGNRLFPTQIAVFPDRIVRYTPQLFGHIEENIAVEQIASVKVLAGMAFSDVSIETTGGSQPIVCHGHWKKDAEAIRKAIGDAQQNNRRAR